MRPIPVKSGNVTCSIPYLFETDRLLLRELSPEDAEEFYFLNLDPDVVRYTGDPPFPNIVDASRFLENYDQYQKFGFGRWAVTLKENGEFIGWCGLKYSPELNGVDLGFRFFKKHWGKGYATEAAKGCIHFGFNHLGLTKIFGRAMKDNKASLRVLEKSGLIFVEEIEFEQHPGMFYSFEKKAASDII